MFTHKRAGKNFKHLNLKAGREEILVMSKIGWFDFQDWEKNELKETELDIEIHKESLTPENKDQDYDLISVFASSKLNEEVLRAIQPKAVFTRSTGYDHIDLETAEELDIEVYNVPNYGANAVAEQAMSLLLAIVRKIPEAIERTHHKFSHEGLEGFELDGKKFGVVGTGDIGKKAIKMAKGFEMDVIAYDPYGDKSLEEELEFMYVSKEDLLKKSDIISLHLPLTEDTRYFLDSEEFAEMDDTVIINTARGAIINSEALLEALENGNVMAAGLDVLEIEEEMTCIQNYREKTEFCQPEFQINCQLIEREDTLVTPHNAFNTTEAKHRILKTTLRNIKERPKKKQVN